MSIEILSPSSGHAQMPSTTEPKKTGSFIETANKVLLLKERFAKVASLKDKEKMNSLLRTAMQEATERKVEPIETQKLLQAIEELVHASEKRAMDSPHSSVQKIDPAQKSSKKILLALGVTLSTPFLIVMVWHSFFPSFSPMYHFREFCFLLINKYLDK